MNLIESGFIVLLDVTARELPRIFELVRQYADSPIDFADASLVVAAERLGTASILTFDRHFYLQRINGKTAFDILTA
jgi:uncharacterized protein